MSVQKMHYVQWVCAVLAAAWLQTSRADTDAHAREVFKSLDWIRGPQSVTLFGNAKFKVPQGYMFLNPDDTKKFMELTQNPSTGHEYLLAPEDMRWFGLFEYEETGYIKDDEKIDAAAVLESIRQGTEAGNKIRRDRGWSTMTVVGWKYAPRYDTQTKRLEWAIDGRSDDESVVNFNTRILGRRGVTSAQLVVDPEGLEAGVREFNDALWGYDYLPGESYQEFRPGDKVAEYGLAALIAGGAAAVAVKTGLWKWLLGALAASWKIVFGAGVAGFAGIRRFFSKKSA